MRLAPEILILEFFREIFFKKHYNDIGAKDLDADELTEDKSHVFSKNERSVLHAMRGRRRKSKNAKSNYFFAPAYYQLAKRGWLGKNRERVIVNFLFEGPIAQYLWHGGETEEKKKEQRQFISKLVDAFVGQNSFDGKDGHSKEILSVALQAIPVEDDIEIAKDNLLCKTKSDTVIKGIHDEIASRIFRDLISLCELEVKIPRM